MSVAGRKQQVLQLTATRHPGGATPVDAAQAVDHARLSLERQGWRVTQAPARQPDGRIFFIAEGGYSAGAQRGQLRLGCVGEFVDVAYPDYAGPETLLTFNFEFTPAQAGAVADQTVVTVWEDLEGWLGQGRVMWEDRG